MKQTAFMQSYTDLFNTRGAPYDRAMQRHPDARRREFLQVITPANIAAGMRVGDVPAGGGYLRAYLPEGAIWEGHEPCSSFAHHGAGGAAATSVPLLPLPWGDATLDVAVSLAGVHHLDDKGALFADIHRVLKPGGTFILSDVAEGSPPALFLDGFVGLHNSTGHDGRYLGPHTLDALHAAGWTIAAHGRQHFTWDFADRDAMGDFACLLFDICKSTPHATAQAIERDLGVQPLPDGQIGMNWSLMTILCNKPAD